MNPIENNGATIDFDLGGDQGNTKSNAIVAIGGKLPHSFRVQTRKLVDVIMALSPQARQLEGKQRQKFRKTISQKLYNKTRPSFYFEARETLHLAYAGQPSGANTQHHWHIFCTDELKPLIETILAGTALTTTPPASEENTTGGNYFKEWGGLYLRSEAEVKIAEALDQTGILFFANARGRVGLQNTLVSDSQLTGRMEADFMAFYQGRCLILEVDGGHHMEGEQTIRDYARDRVLLRSGVPTVRFTAKDCMIRPHEVVSEFLSILMQKD